MKLSYRQIIDLVLASFDAEKSMNLSQGLNLIHSDFAVTEMNVAEGDKVLPRLKTMEAKQLMAKAFQIKGRNYQFINVLADEANQVAMVEFIESYPDPKTAKVYRTPVVAVCHIKDGKIYRTRHYTDPRLSYKYLSQAAIDQALE